MYNLKALKKTLCALNKQNKNGELDEAITTLRKVVKDEEKTFEGFVHEYDESYPEKFEYKAVVVNSEGRLLTFQA